MKIIIVNRKTKEIIDTEPNLYIGQDGAVYEFIFQSFANHACMIERSELELMIEESTR